LRTAAAALAIWAVYSRFIPVPDSLALTLVHACLISAVFLAALTLLRAVRTEELAELGKPLARFFRRR
jgi:hypothetical protein